MKQKWSPEWKSSVQPRKQRKYRHNAPLHVRHKFLGARLAPDLTKQFGRRSLAIRKGDEIRVMRGTSKGIKGVVERVNLKKTRVYAEGIMVKNVDGSEVMKPLQPSNVMITKPKMDDKRRQMVTSRTDERAKKLRSHKPEKKHDEKPKTEKKEDKKPESKDKKPETKEKE